MSFLDVHAHLFVLLWFCPAQHPDRISPIKGRVHLDWLSSTFSTLGFPRTVSLNMQEEKELVVFVPYQIQKIN